MVLALGYKKEVTMKRRLMRSRKENVLAGVCGGISEYFNIDVMVVRALWILSAIFDGPGLLVYFICALIIPKIPVGYEYDEDSAPYYDEDKKERSKNYMALGFIGIGIYLVVKILVPWLNFKFLWPVALIGVGIMLLNKNSD